MGKLNSLIKFIVFNANALLFLGGVGMIIVACLVLTADFIKLAQTYLMIRGIVMVVVGILIGVMSVIGCVGTHRQIQRDRLWSGRRILSLYQVLLVAVVVGQGLVQLRLYSIEVSLQEAATELPNDHGEFESRFRDGFNEAYYDQLCSGSAGGDGWVWSLVDAHCPDAISREACSVSCSEGDGRESGGLRQCLALETYTAQDCCPDESFCEEGRVEACPYASCRTGILEGLLNYITPARKYSTFVFVLEGLVLVLTCLLICYNPRDSTEDILIKTGTLVKHHGGDEDEEQAPGAGKAGAGAGAAGGGATGGGGGGGGGGGLNLAGLQGAGRGAKHRSAASSDVFELAPVQPAAMAAARRARGTAGGARGESRGGSPIGSTPSLSPLAEKHAPVEPLQQYMTPRRQGSQIVFVPDSPEGDDGDTFFEYQNPRKGKSATVGPLSSGRSTASQKARASAGAGAGAASSATTIAATAAAVRAAAAAAAGLIAAGTPPGRQGEEKREQSVSDKEEDKEEEEKEILESGGALGDKARPSPVRLMEYDDDDGDDGYDSRDFYGGMDVQTPVAEYEDPNKFERGENPAASKPAGDAAAAAAAPARALGKLSSLDPATFLTDASSAPSELHPSQVSGSRSFQEPPSPITTPPKASPGDYNNNGRGFAGGRPSRFGGQTPIIASPVAAKPSGGLSVATSTTAAAEEAGAQGDGAGAPSTTSFPRRPTRFSAQTPISSPIASSRPTRMEQTPTPASAEVVATGGRMVGARPPEVNGGDPTETNPGEPDNAEKGSSPKQSSSLSSSLNIVPASAAAADVDDSHPEEDAHSIGSPPGPSASFLGQMSAQTPTTAAAPIGFNTPTMCLSQEEEGKQQRQRRGSAAYLRPLRCASSLAADTETSDLAGAIREELPPLPRPAAESAPKPELVARKEGGGGSRAFSGQTPISTPRNAAAAAVLPEFPATEKGGENSQEPSTLSEKRSPPPGPAEAAPKPEIVARSYLHQTPISTPRNAAAAAAAAVVPEFPATDQGDESSQKPPALSEEQSSSPPAPVETSPKPELAARSYVHQTPISTPGNAAAAAAVVPEFPATDQGDESSQEPPALSEEQSSSPPASAETSPKPELAARSDSDQTLISSPKNGAAVPDLPVVVEEGGSQAPTLLSEDRSSDRSPRPLQPVEPAPNPAQQGYPPSADANPSTAAPVVSGDEPQSMFRRFLLKAQDSVSRAQMAMTLELESALGNSPEASPAHISPLRGDLSAATTSGQATAAATAGASAGASAGGAADVGPEPGGE